MASAIALKYARAMADVAFESKTEDRVLAELQSFAKLLASHAQLREAFENPAIPFSSKRGVLERLAQRLPLSKHVSNFTLIILENNRIRQFDDFAAAFQEVVNQRRGIVRARVHSARDLPEPVKTRLGRAMSEHLGKKVELSYRTDPSLIGGLKLEVGSMIFDGSIRTRLDVIHKKLVSQ